MKRSALFFLFCAIGCLLFIPVARAAQVTVAWDVSTDSNVVSYKIYYGTSSRSYLTSILVSGREHNYVVIFDLDPDLATYYFAATALDASGNESDFSAEISWTFVTSSYVASDGTVYNTTIWKKSGTGNGSTSGEYLIFGSSGSATATTYKYTFASADVYGKNKLSWRAAWFQPLASYAIVQAGTETGDKYLFFYPLNYGEFPASSGSYLRFSLFDMEPNTLDGGWHQYDINVGELIRDNLSTNLIMIKSISFVVIGLGPSLFVDDVVVYATVE